MDELSLDDVMTGEEAAEMFAPPDDKQEDFSTSEEQQNEETNTNENENTAEVNNSELFTEEQPEGVGSEENIKGEKNPSNEEQSSPDFFSSIAKALAEEGVFSSLDDDDISNVTDAESFKELIENSIQQQFDDRQRRIDEALNLGIEPSEIKKYENSLNILDNITEEQLSAEDEKSENIRKNIIYEDYILKGFSKERAIKAVERSFAAGTDIEDAKDALQSCKEQYTNAYNNLLNEAEQQQKALQEEQRQQAEDLRNDILSENKAFGELDLDRKTRQRIYDAVAKPSFTDSETGEQFTALQRYQQDNPNDFMKYVGLTYVLTNGFKSLDGLVKGKVKKEVKKGLRELEHTLSNTPRNSDGSLKFTSGISDPESSYRSFTLDI